MGQDLKKRLRNVRKQWKKAKTVTPESGFERAPDGKYIARLTAMEVKDSAKGNLMLVSTWTIVRGDHAGMDGMMWHGIEDESKMPWLMDYLRKLEVDIDTLDIEDLPDLAAEILKSRPGGRISLRTKDGDFQNCRLEQYMEVDEDEDQAEGEDVELSIGSRVSTDWEGDTYIGKVIRLHPKTDQATVLFDETDEEELCELSDLEVVVDEDEVEDEDEDEDDDDAEEDVEEEDKEDEEEDEEEVLFDVGDSVAYEGKGGTKTGTCIAIADGTVRIRVSPKRTVTLPTESVTRVGAAGLGDEDDEDDEAEEEDRPPVKGDEVTVTYRKKERDGVVVRVSKRAKTCMVKIGMQEKEYPFDGITIHTDDG